MTTTSPSTQTAAALEAPPRRMRTRSRSEWKGLAFVAPFLVVFLLVFIAPVAYSIYLSLFREQLIGGNAFVGLENYLALFGDPQFWEGFGRVVLFLLIQVPIMLGLALVAALAIDSARLHASGFFRIVIFLPYAVPAVVAVLMWGFIYGDNFGLAANINDWLGSEVITPFARNWILASIGNIVTWEFVGYNMLIFYSALRVIPTDLYEAAELDGAGPMRVITGIKLPAAARRDRHRHDLLDHRQLPALQRAQHPAHARAEHHHHLLHAEHVRLQPVVRRPAVQLLGHGRDRHGRDHRGDRLRRAAPRLAEGRTMSATVAPEVRPVDEQRADAASAGRGPRRGPRRTTRRCARASRWRSRCSWAIFVLYSLVPLAWLVINATKTQSGLFSSFGLWFDDDFVLFQNIWETLTYRDGIFLRWFGNTLLYVVLGAGGATLLATLAGLRAREVPVRRAPRGLRRRARRDRGAGHGARGADVPACSASSASRTRRGRSSSRR